MAICLNDIMSKDAEFMKRWKETPTDNKEYIRATVLDEAAKFINERAFDDFGMHNAAVGMEISKLVLIAKDCLEKQEQKD